MQSLVLIDSVIINICRRCESHHLTCSTSFRIHNVISINCYTAIYDLTTLETWRVWMEASPINDAQTAICSAASLFRRARSDVDKGCVGQTYPTERPPFWFIEKFFTWVTCPQIFFLTTCQRRNWITSTNNDKSADINSKLVYLWNRE